MRKHKSFQEKYYITVMCAKCGEKHTENHDYLISVFETKAEAIESLKEHEWLVKGNDVFCPECI